MVEKMVTVQNPTGFHARPAGLFVKKAGQYKSQIEIIFMGKRVSAKSIMGVMGLGLSKGHQITISANGEDAEEAVNALSQLASSTFD